jgi:hypothetical protein
VDQLGVHALDPLLRREEEAVPPGFVSNSLEFEGIKNRVVELLPHSEEENGVFVLKPLLDECPSALKMADHVGEGNAVAFLTGRFGGAVGSLQFFIEE